MNLSAKYTFNKYNIITKQNYVKNGEKSQELDEFTKPSIPIAEMTTPS